MCVCVCVCVCVCWKVKVRLVNAFSGGDDGGETDSFALQVATWLLRCLLYTHTHTHTHTCRLLYRDWATRPDVAPDYYFLQDLVLGTADAGADVIIVQVQSLCERVCCVGGKDGRHRLQP